MEFRRQLSAKRGHRILDARRLRGAGLHLVGVERPVLRLRKAQTIGQLAILGDQIGHLLHLFGAGRVDRVGLQVRHPVGSDGEALGRLDPLLRIIGLQGDPEMHARLENALLQPLFERLGRFQMRDVVERRAAAHHRAETQRADAGDEQQN